MYKKLFNVLAALFNWNESWMPLYNDKNDEVLTEVIPTVT